MNKDFDAWNTRKINIHNNRSHKLYQEREIWWCFVGINIGFEEDGTGEGNERPVLILHGFSKQVCLVAPLTTSTKQNPYHIPLGLIDGKHAFVITSQVKLIDTKRLINKIGRINNESFALIRKTIRDFF
jgi:mRNA interferase MazF